MSRGTLRASSSIEKGRGPEVREPAHSCAGPICRKSFGCLENSNIDGAVSAVGWALLPVGDNDGQECPSYEDQGKGDFLLLELGAIAEPKRENAAE